ncbi:hypothetical protein [Synechococcus phage Ssp-JY38]|nr:hypothetical protein [Synechococcus phage Yong-L2-223]
MAKRKTNQQICAEFRSLLTQGAAMHMDEQTLEATKPWRNDVWKAFREIEDRMCPTPEIARRYVQEGT